MTRLMSLVFGCVITIIGDMFFVWTGDRPYPQEYRMALIVVIIVCVILHCTVKDLADATSTRKSSGTVSKSENLRRM